MDKILRSKHPYEAYIPPNASKLIIGTIPPYRFCVPDGKLQHGDVNFYYGSKDNSFWKLIAEVTGEKLHYENTEEAVKERKSLLDRMHIGITDIVESCIHTDQKSDDASLSEIRQKDLAQLLSDHAEIDTLIYTSQFVAGLVGKCADKTYHYWLKPSREGCIYIGGKLYRVIVLYSPSRNALRSVSEAERLEQYQSVFGKK